MGSGLPAQPHVCGRCSARAPRGRWFAEPGLGWAMGVALMGRLECASLSHGLPLAPASPQEVGAVVQM